MNNEVLTGSITYAVKAKEILNRNGFKAYMGRKKDKTKSGCGYFVSFDGDAEKAKKILEENNVKFSEIH